MRQVSPAEIGPPASVNRYLLPHERSCITVRMHPAVLAGHLILASGGLVAARKLTSRSGRPDIVRGAYLLLLLGFFRQVAAWPVTYFVVTNERMLVIRGPFSRTVTAMPLDKAMGLKLQRTVLGRLLGYGSLTVVSPDRRQAFRKVRYLPYPEQLYLEISGLLWPDEVARPEQEEDNSPNLGCVH
jgi:PH (Pleckstrin Homology) domain-containing protein